MAWDWSSSRCATVSPSSSHATIPFPRAIAHHTHVRADHNIGQYTAGGVLVEGTDEAIREEMDGVLRLVKGRYGDEMRVRMKTMGRDLERDVAKGGGSYEEMMKITRLGG